MQKTLQIKLNLTKEQKLILDKTLKEYIDTVNVLVKEMDLEKQVLKLTTKDFEANLPSAVKNQCIRDAKSAYTIYLKRLKKQEKKKPKLPIFKKPVCIWNNQNYTIKEQIVSFPIWLGKSKRIAVKAFIPEYYRTLLSNKLGTLRITKKSHKYIAQITIEIEEQRQSTGTNIMGVDLGIKVPAVCYASNGKVKFIGNGRENKYIRRKFKTKRQTLGKAKKQKAIKKIRHKEQRIMQDKDHKYSKAIVTFAKKNNVSIIRLEKLDQIRNTTRTSRKNNHSLHNWSFYRLAKYIEYKAEQVGIKVEYVNPAYTSQVCPCCGKKNHAKDRRYSCTCGYNTHRDIVGAMNIMSVIDGNSLSA